MENIIHRDDPTVLHLGRSLRLSGTLKDPEHGPQTPRVSRVLGEASVEEGSPTRTHIEALVSTAQHRPDQLRCVLRKRGAVLFYQVLQPGLYMLKLWVGWAGGCR